MERITRKLILKWNLWQMCSWKSLKISLKRFLSWNLTQKLKSFFLEKGYRHILFESCKINFILNTCWLFQQKKRTFVFQINRWIFLADKEKVTMIIHVFKFINTKLPRHNISTVFYRFVIIWFYSEPKEKIYIPPGRKTASRNLIFLNQQHHYIFLIKIKLL